MSIYGRSVAKYDVLAISHSASSLGNNSEVAGELVVRKRLALEEQLGYSRARPDGDLRRREVRRPKHQAHGALQVDVHALPALFQFERQESTVWANVRHASSVAFGGGGDR